MRLGEGLKRTAVSSFISSVPFSTIEGANLPTHTLNSFCIKLKSILFVEN